MKINIVSPCDNIDEIAELAKAGATEVYCGVLTREWEDAYTTMGSANRREWRTNNFRDYSEFKKAVKIAHTLGIRISLTLNKPFYTADQYGLLRKEIRQAVAAKTDSFIVADLGLLLLLRKMKIKQKLIMSAVGVVLNSSTVDFYKNLGVGRVIFPRHITFDEVKKIVEKSKGMDFEVFILNEGCFNVDGLCSFSHGFEADWNQRTLACSIPYEVEVISKNKIDWKTKERIGSRIKGITKNLSSSCGACDLYDFSSIGIRNFKIVGRGNSLDKKLKDIEFIKSLSDKLQEKQIKNQNFIALAKEDYKRLHGIYCKTQRCYYPKFK